jgi:hypothetical protein
MVNFALYERRLNKAGVKIISITQPTGEEVSGEMMRRIISLFDDEYQSRENSKHTLRAMNENARRGFFNGSMPPFGYKLERSTYPARKARNGNWALDETEVGVHKIVDLYRNGDRGRTLGMLGVTKTLNGLNITFRGRKWSKKKIDDILKDRSYVGEHYFQQKGQKNKQAQAEGRVGIVSYPFDH